VPSGFQEFNDSNALMIDSDFVNLALIRKGQVTTAAYTDGPTTTNPTRATVTVAQGEILAFACASAPTAVVGREGNSVTLAASAEAGAIIYYWIFGPGTTQSTFGRQVFAADGTLAFDSGWKLFNVQGTTSGEGTFQFPAGKSYAVIHQDIRTRLVYRSFYQGVAPNVFIVDYRLTYFSAAKINGASIEVAAGQADLYVQTRRTGELGPTGEETNGVTPSFLVIDVTGY